MIDARYYTQICRFVKLAAPYLAVALLWLVLGLLPGDQVAVDAVRNGDRLAAKWEYSAALRSYHVAALRCPGDPLPRLRQVKVYLAQGRRDEAWSAFLAAIERGGVDDRALESLAAVYAAQGSAARATAVLNELLAHRPGRSDLWLWLGELQMSVGDRARACLSLERALALGLTPRQAQVAHDRLGMAYLDDPLRALEHFVAAGSGPDVEVAQRARWMAEALRSRVEGGPDALSLAQVGEALLRRGELTAARRFFAASLALAPDYVDAHAYLGHTLSLLGEDKAAVNHLLRAIELEPTYPLTYYFLGVHYARRGRWAKAREYLMEAHDLDSDNPAICAAMADTYLRDPEPNYAVAEIWLHAAVDRAPDDPRFHLLLAHFYVDYLIDPGNRGIAVAQVAVDLAPDDWDAQSTLGWAYYLAGRPGDALAPLERARALAPRRARVYFRLGEVYRALGDESAARKCYRRAIDLDWNGPVGQRAREAMSR